VAVAVSGCQRRHVLPKVASGLVHEVGLERIGRGWRCRRLVRDAAMRQWRPRKTHTADYQRSAVWSVTLQVEMLRRDLAQRMNRATAYPGCPVTTSSLPSREVLKSPTSCTRGSRKDAVLSGGQSDVRRPQQVEHTWRDSEGPTVARCRPHSPEALVCTVQYE
jgi:hypothetical protein